MQIICDVLKFLDFLNLNRISLAIENNCFCFVIKMRTNAQNVPNFGIVTACLFTKQNCYASDIQIDIPISKHGKMYIVATYLNSKIDFNDKQIQN